MDAKTLKKSLGQLDVKRQSLEMEGEAIISELTAEPESGGKSMGIDTPLVDHEGYPRGDVDVYRARDLRQRLAVIRTDRKELMKQIDTVLSQISLVQVRTSTTLRHLVASPLLHFLAQTLSLSAYLFFHYSESQEIGNRSERASCPSSTQTKT